MPSIPVALKEWSIVCDLLIAGRCCLLLRKGGIHEYAGPGRFALEYNRFALFPAWEHERIDRIRPDFLLNDAARYERGEPVELTIRGYAEVPEGCIWQVPSRESFDELEDLHPWATDQIDMRFGYKPDRPLYLLVARAYRLAEPVTLPNRPTFAGCKSWVPLDGADAIDPDAATAAMSDADFLAVQARVAAVMAKV